MNAPADSDIRKIYEKSVRLLNDKQAHLMEMRQVLKKAVIRLSFASRCENRQVNSVLDNINNAVEDRVDIDTLNTQLDNLFVLINHADYHNTIRGTASFYKQLQRDLKNYRKRQDKESLIPVLMTLADKELSDAEMSREVIKLVEGIRHTASAGTDDLYALINNLKENTDYSYDVSDTDPSRIMQDLSDDLIRYINGLHETSEDEKDEMTSVSQVLIDVVNKLTLPRELKKKQLRLSRSIHKHEDESEYMKKAINKLVTLVNKSIASIQAEKQGLETYLTKISGQLSDIESFMHDKQKDEENKKSRDAELTDSVETSMMSIEQSVSESSDLDELKHSVSDTLLEIRKHVEEYKQVNEEKDIGASEDYTRIIEELSKAQNESKVLKAQLKESKTQMLRDTLTGIPNRLAYNERISVEVHRWRRTKAPLCLAVWDIDHFKNFNDAYGHSVGDKVLKLFSEIIQSRVRKVDHFARVGGEEFVLLMPDTPVDIALTLNNTLRVMLEECNFHYDGKHCPITASVGIAEFRDGDDADSVLDNADKALYESKNNGRNQCTVYQGE